MKYRVKDPKKRELVKELFGVEIVRSNFADTELRVDFWVEIPNWEKAISVFEIGRNEK